jgi:hypothetical protein
MPKAYIIEVHDQTAGIVTVDEGSVRFFSSNRAFDRLDGQEFRSARDAERAATALFSVTRRHRMNRSAAARLD